MPTDMIRYDLLVQDALRGVVRRVLTEASREGLPGDHHFYVTFRTPAPGVRLSNRMRERYPDEMTIVLQHQFWDLSVTDANFEVGLSFNNSPESVLVPFDAVTQFGDPSVGFALKFELQEPEPEEGANDSEPSDPVPAPKPAAPIPLARISSRYNPRRMHPVLKVVMPHNGVDYAAASGTPVYAVAPGTVRSVGDGGPCGNMVQLQHDRGLVSAYCHFSRFAAKLVAGQKVNARQLVGYVGRTGRATGPHLHFAMKRNDVFFDPLTLNFDGVRTLPRKQARDFTQRKAELDPILDGIRLLGDAPPDEAEEKDEILDEVPDAGN